MLAAGMARRACASPGHWALHQALLVRLVLRSSKALPPRSWLHRGHLRWVLRSQGQHQAQALLVLFALTQAQDQALDAAIMQAWSSGPGVVWISPGTGGHSPRKQRHVFMENKLQHGARIDFYRGTLADDRCNKQWSSWLRRLPCYEQLAGTMWSGATQPGEGPSSEACLKARGNAMEIAVGLAWAATTDGRYLREGHT